MTTNNLNTHARIAASGGMNKFSWKWNLSKIKQDKDVSVFSTFSCGGGSTMGYKRAGFKVLGNVEIDSKTNNMYIANHHPEYNFCMDLRKFNETNPPEELIGIDILDGSPPCTSFSTAGIREEGWGKEKKFREGQVFQTLDDLFFVFLDTVEKLQPKIVVAENVVGMVKGKARGYVNMIIKRFREIGYQVQLFQLNGGGMDVPQARNRLFFIANRMGYDPLRLDFHHTPILFKEIRSEKGADFGTKSKVLKSLIEKAIPSDRDLRDTAQRLTGEGNKYFTQKIIHDDEVAPTITSSGEFYRFFDRRPLSDEDFRNAQSFPQDYNFMGNDVQYVCGMSVPPNMMANIATEIYDQWLS